MMWRNILTLLLFIFASPFALADTCGASDQEIQQIIDQARMDHQIPAVQVSILCDGENAPHNFISGSTTIEGATPVNSENLFQVGSQTKSFIAAAILQLEVAGKININAPFVKYLPTLPYAIPAEWRYISIKQLLNHTSGIYDYSIDNAFLSQEINTYWQNAWAPETLIQYPVDHDAATTGFNYSNSDYILLGMIIENITGHSLGDELAIRFFKPLMLDHTYYLPGLYDDQIKQQLAHGYDFYAADYMPGTAMPVDVINQDMSWAGAAGCLLSTSSDMAIWLSHLMSDNHLLPPKQRAELMTLVDLNTGKPIDPSSDGYGLGIQHFGKSSSSPESWGHAGGTNGYSALMMWYPQKNLVITTNASDGNRQAVPLENKLAAYILSIQNNSGIKNA